MKLQNAKQYRLKHRIKVNHERYKKELNTKV